MKKTKLFFVFFFALIFTQQLIANIITLQGKLTRITGEPITGNYWIKVEFYESQSSDTVIWSTEKQIYIEDGLYSVEISTDANFFFDKQYWVKISIKPQYGSDYESFPKYQLTYSPYAYYAKEASKAIQADYATGIVSTSAISMSGNPILDVSTMSVGFIISTSPATMPLVISTSVYIVGYASATKFYGDGSGLLSISSIAVNSVGSPQIIDGTIVDADISPAAAIAISKLATSGTLGSGVIASSIAVNAVYTGAIQDGAITSAKIKDGTITNNDLATGSFTNITGVGTLQNDLKLQNSTFYFVVGSSEAKVLYEEVKRSTEVPAIVFSTNVYVIGDMRASGNKYFIHKIPELNLQINYISIEGGEAGVYFRGTAKLINGEAVVSLPEHFTLVTSTIVPLTVVVTPQENCNGLYVAKKSTKEIVIKELQNGKSNAEFDYIVIGVRKGYENVKIVERIK